MGGGRWLKKKMGEGVNLPEIYTEKRMVWPKLWDESQDHRICDDGRRENSGRWDGSKRPRQILRLL